MRHLVMVSSCLWLCGCDSGGDAVPKGVEAMGTYAMTAIGSSKVCMLPSVPATYGFGVRLSRLRDGGAVFFTEIAQSGTGLTFDAGFDGQFVTSAVASTAPYAWEDGGSCASCTSTLTVENYQLALLSRSQSAALSDTCPTDGGVLPPDDAGATLPGSRDGGFDAVRLCGVARINITGSGFSCDPICSSCQLVYSISGQRR